MILLHISAFLIGISIVAWTLFSAVRSIVWPRGMPDNLTRTVFILTWQVFRFRLRWTSSYLQQDRIDAYFAPFALLMLLPTWYTLVLVGFTGMYWSLGAGSAADAFALSGVLQC